MRSKRLSRASSSVCVGAPSLTRTGCPFTEKVQRLTLRPSERRLRTVVLLEHVHVQLLDHSSNGIAKVPFAAGIPVSEVVRMSA